MAIDLNSCIGCNACVVACLGREQYSRRRQRRSQARARDALAPDRPLLQRRARQSRDVSSAGAVHAMRKRALRSRSVPSMPPTHSEDGLNDMIYNRCVGTRYCSNNCPYKVRRFNFFQYQRFHDASLKLSAQSGRHRAHAAASWKNAPTACSASTRRRSKRAKENRARARRRDRHRLPAGLPDRRRSSLAISTIRNSRVAELKAQTAELRLIDRIEYPAADDLSGAS